jgi:hypothetical protein
MVVHDKPNDFFVWDHVNQFHLGNVDVFVMIGKLIIE